MNNATKSKASLQQILALASVFASTLADILSGEQVQKELENKTKLKAKIRKLFDVSDMFADIRDDWQKFYQMVFGIEIDLAGVSVPEKPEGNYRLLFIAKGCTPNKVYDAWIFPKWKYNDNLDKAVTANKRKAIESYAIWVLAGDEPDAEFLGKSTNQADPGMEIGMTLLERMIFESKYFAETGKHLDIKGATFCSGSRDADGNVPFVCWYPGSQEVCVDWHYVSHSVSRYGVRRAV